MFAILILTLIALSNLTPCSASPLQLFRRPALAARGAAWKPSAGTTWDYQLTGTINLDSINVDVWDIDLFDASASLIDKIHAKGKHVICYFSAGSFEDWRPDASKFQASDKGRALDGWAGENWLQTKSSNVRKIMLARLDLAVQRKCDAVEPDNVDSYDNRNGLGLTENDAVNYVTFLADAAHARNMAVALKNAGGIVSRLVNIVDFSVQEECVQYGNCAEFKPFIQQNKPVFHVEYSNGGANKRDAWREDRYNDDDSENYGLTDEAANGDGTVDQVATSSKAYSAASGSYGCTAKVAGFSSIMKNLNLDAWVQLCP